MFGFHDIETRLVIKFLYLGHDSIVDRYDPVRVLLQARVVRNHTYRFAFIREQYGEGNTWHVLDRKNGKLTPVDGYPLFSPNGKAFVAIQTDLDAQYSSTRMDVYDASGPAPRRLFQTLTDEESLFPKWGPVSVYWCDNATIVFQRAVGEAYVRSDTLEALALRNGRWRMEPTAPDRCRSISP